MVCNYCFKYFGVTLRITNFNIKFLPSAHTEHVYILCDSQKKELVFPIEI